MLVPIGRDGGFIQIGKVVLGDEITQFLKARDGFVKIMWGRFGLKPPE